MSDDVRSLVSAAIVGGYIGFMGWLLLLVYTLNVAPEGAVALGSPVLGIGSVAIGVSIWLAKGRR